MPFSTTVALSGRCLMPFIVFLLAFVAVDSVASVTVTKTNNTGAVVDNSSVDQTVSFSAADFGGKSSIIGKITVSITFAKLSLGPLFKPGFDEVAFTLTGLRDHGDHTHVEEIKLIKDGDFKEGAAGAFFVGTVTFDQDAAKKVNDDKDQIQSGTFRPKGDLSKFYGSDGARNWKLTIYDDNDKAAGNTPLALTSWSVTITNVPEPDSLGLLGTAGLLAALIVFHRPGRRGDRVSST